MAAPFQKSWSIHGFKRCGISTSNLNKSRASFHACKSTKINLEDRFSRENLIESQYNVPSTVTPMQDEPDLPFYLKPHPGMKFRSLTETNIRRFDVNAVAKSHNERESPRARIHQPFRHIPERIGPILQNIQNTMVQAGPKTEKFFQKGGKKVQKAVEDVRTSLNSFSQKFKKTTKRRYKLDSNTPTRTPSRTPSREVTITPGKLYSPFDVNTPRTPHSYMRGTKRLQHGPSRRSFYGADNLALCRTPVNQPLPSGSSNPVSQWTRFDSPASYFHQGVNSDWDMNRGCSPHMTSRFDSPWRLHHHHHPRM